MNTSHTCRQLLLSGLLCRDSILTNGAIQGRTGFVSYLHSPVSAQRRGCFSLLFVYTIKARCIDEWKLLPKTHPGHMVLLIRTSGHRPHS